MRFIIRPARADELEGLGEDLSRAYLQNLLAVPLPMEEAEPLADIGMRQMVRNSAGSEQLLVLVVEDTDARQLAGAFIVGFIASLKAANCLYIWVKDTYRGRASLTRKMFRHAEALVKERGALRMDGGVLLCNDRARQMYERLGYVTFGHLMMKRL